MYNALNAEQMLIQADELRREMVTARNTRGARRWWRREHDVESGEQAARRAR